MNRQVLLVSIGFSPNVGGIETHFDDLVDGLKMHNWIVTVLTYQPLTSNIKAPYFEYSKSLSVFRLPILKGIFYKFVKYPVLEFLFLTPGLFLFLPFILLNNRKIKVVHSHGIIAGFVSLFWGKIFNIKVITTTHSIYNFPKSGLYRNLASFIFKNSDSVLCLSDQSLREVKGLGVPASKIKRFTYWINLKKFSHVPNAKSKLNLKRYFVVLFVGRLIQEKGLKILLNSLKSWPKNTELLIAGIGPLEKLVQSCEINSKYNVRYLGNVSQNKLPLYYSAADLLIVPSIHEEGFGRVIIESLACGTPVVGANRGAIPEAMNSSVGKLITISEESISKSIKQLSVDMELMRSLKNASRPYAVKNYSNQNLNIIIDQYKS